MEKKNRNSVTLNVTPETRAALKVMAALERKTLAELVGDLAAAEYSRRADSGMLKVAQ